MRLIIKFKKNTFNFLYKAWISIVYLFFLFELALYWWYRTQNCQHFIQLNFDVDFYHKYVINSMGCYHKMANLIDSTFNYSMLMVKQLCVCMLLVFFYSDHCVIEYNNFRRLKKVPFITKVGRVRCDVGHYYTKGCILSVAEIIPNVSRSLCSTIYGMRSLTSGFTSAPPPRACS